MDRFCPRCLDWMREAAALRCLDWMMREAAALARTARSDREDCED